MAWVDSCQVVKGQPYRIGRQHIVACWRCSSNRFRSPFDSTFQCGIPLCCMPSNRDLCIIRQHIGRRVTELRAVLLNGHHGSVETLLFGRSKQDKFTRGHVKAKIPILTWSIHPCALVHVRFSHAVNWRRKLFATSKIIHKRQTIEICIRICNGG